MSTALYSFAIAGSFVSAVLFTVGGTLMLSGQVGPPPPSQAQQRWVIGFAVLLWGLSSMTAMIVLATHFDKVRA